MRCPACGSQPHQPAARFCGNCGTSLEPSRGAGAEINVTQSISGSPEGEISGVTVGEIAGNVSMNIVQIHVSPEVVEEIRAVPTEMQPSTNIASGANPANRDEVKNQIQGILEAAARSNPHSRRIRIGNDEVSRVDMLLKNAVLLETEAGQMFLDTVERNREAVERAKARSAGSTFTLDLADLLGGFDGDAPDRKLREALSILQEANRLDPANTEVLVHLAGVLGQINPDDFSESRRILFRVQQLLENPKNDAEKFRLAQATYLLATNGPNIHEESLLDARAMFQQLGRTGWVNQCDLQLNHSRRLSPARYMQGGPGGPNPQIPQRPIGHWQVSVSDGRVISMTLVNDGSFRASMMMPGFGYEAFGNWQEGPSGSFLSFQGIINGVQPFGVRISIQTRQADFFTGIGSDGLSYHFQRMSAV